MESLISYAKEAASIAIGGHVRPDGDCTGSCLGVYNYLKNLYPEKTIHVYLEPIPEKYLFLSRSAEAIHPADYVEKDPYDLFIALDCGDANRLGKAEKICKKAKYSICIDHHISNDGFADENYVVPDASSACELVYGLMDTAHLTKEIAECLYLGLVQDTGVFQYSCTSAKTMQIAGALMEYGIDYPRIVDETFFQKTYKEQRIFGKALEESALCLDGKCIYSVLKQETLNEFEVTGADLEGIVSSLRSTKGVEASIFLYELVDHRFKISMRSASYVDVAEIMGHFGGGGHCRAAGGSSGKSAEEIIAEITELVREQLEKHEESVCTTAL